MLLISGGVCGAADAADAAVGGGATTDSTSPSFSPILLRNTCAGPRHFSDFEGCYSTSDLSTLLGLSSNRCKMSRNAHGPEPI